jgi:hypothetical protein
MVKMIVVQRGEEIQLEMRGNFLRIVDRSRSQSEIAYVNGKGHIVHLDYDVQAAVIELFTEATGWKNVATTRGDEATSLRGVLRERDGVILQLKEDRKTAVGTGNITLGGFVAWGERVKDLFFKAPKP